MCLCTGVLVAAFNDDITAATQVYALSVNAREKITKLCMCFLWSVRMHISHKDAIFICIISHAVEKQIK